MEPMAAIGIIKSKEDRFTNITSTIPRLYKNLKQGDEALVKTRETYSYEGDWE